MTRLTPELQERIWQAFQRQRQQASLDAMARKWARLFGEVWGDQRAVENLLTEVGYTGEVEA